MRGFAGYVLIGVVAALATGAMVLAGLGLAVSARPVAEPDAVIQHVDRTHKGDRLDLRSTIGTQPVPNHRQAAPIGCEPVFSPLSSVPRNPPGRCVA